MEIKTLKTTEMPDVNEMFYLIRINDSVRLILERYERYQNGNWGNEVVYEFKLPTHDLEGILKEIEPILSKNHVKVLYIEEGTLDDEIKGI